MADQLCTLAQITARLQSSAGGVIFTVADNTLINELIDQTSDWVQHYTGRKLVPVTSTDYYFDTQLGYILRIPMGIRAITFLGVNNQTHQPDSGGTYTTVTAADYLIRPRFQDLPVGWPATEVWISRGTLAGTIARFGTIQNGCKITMTAGFAATPPDITAVVIDAVVTAYQNRKNGASGMLGADDTALLPWVSFFSKGSPQRGTLDRYRYVSLA